MNVNGDGSDVMALDQGSLVISAEESDVVHPVRRRTHHLGRPEGESLLLGVDLNDIT